MEDELLQHCVSVGLHKGKLQQLRKHQLMVVRHMHMYGETWIKE